MSVSANDTGKVLLQPDDVGVGLWLENGPGRLGAVRRPSRFPMEINFVWGLCMGAQGA
jgi:hypothetical protein